MKNNNVKKRVRGDNRENKRKLKKLLKDVRTKRKGYVKSRFAIEIIKLTPSCDLMKYLKFCVVYLKHLL